MANFGFSRPPPPRRPLQRAVRAPELFEQLLGLKWRSVPLPYSSIRVTLDHDLVEHKYYGVDGVNLEDTGLDGMQIEAVMPFYNNIAAGKAESWGNTRPYPNLFRLFWDAFRDRTTGELQHPELGIIDCKPHNIVFPLDADHRGGAEVTASWRETTPLFDTGESDRYKASPIAAAQRAALDLDASAEDLRGLVPQMELPIETFDTAINKLTAVVDRTTTSAQLLAHKPVQILSRIQTLQRSVERARTSAAWPVVDACERLRAAVLAMTPSRTSKPVKRYKTPARTSLAMVANTLGVSTDDLVRLNPSLLSQLEVLQGTIVLYYG